MESFLQERTNISALLAEVLGIPRDIKMQRRRIDHLLLLGARWYEMLHACENVGVRFSKKCS